LANTDEQFNANYKFDKDAIYDNVVEVLSCWGKGMMDDFKSKCDILASQANAGDSVHWGRWKEGDWSVQRVEYEAETGV
jgi:hypothetical protein